MTKLRTLHTDIWQLICKTANWYFGIKKDEYMAIIIESIFIYKVLRNGEKEQLENNLAIIQKIHMPIRIIFPITDQTLSINFY